ncbi:hypothetical protein [Acetobacter orleanensis]|nr:hypothetical protein [Acetobacter orleanensis]
MRLLHQPRQIKRDDISKRQTEPLFYVLNLPLTQLDENVAACISHESTFFSKVFKTLKFMLIIRCVSVSMLAAISGCTDAGAERQPHETNFRVFNGTRFANADDLDRAGLLPFTSIYDVWKLTCDETQCYNVPTESQFKKTLASYVAQFRSSSFIAFDFENIVIDKATSAEQANNEVQLLKKFIVWTRESYPKAKIGIYDYDFNSKFLDIRAKIYREGGFDFFAPTMYQRWPNHDIWSARLQAAITNDHTINKSLPIYAYISPYKAGVTKNGFLGDAEWLAQLADTRRVINGVIVWTQSSTAIKLDTNQSWEADLRHIVSGKAP